jgi:glycerol-3-phosphate O-acyltransferase
MTGPTEITRIAPSHEPIALLRWLYKRFFSHIVVDDRFREVVRDSAARGVVVHVMRSLSLLDFLCLDFLTKKLDLPIVRFVNDLGLWILEPFGRGERRLRLRRQIPEGDALAQVVKEGESALLFLRKPPTIGSGRKGEALETDLFRTLIDAQRTMEKPILLVPEAFVWSKLPGTKKPGVFDFFFGPVEWPGKVRVLFQFLLNARNALLRSGEPFDLRAFLEEHPSLTDEELADKVRYALLRRIERERSLVIGPAQKTPTRIQDELIRSPRVRKHIDAEARASKRPVPKVEADARRELDKLAANQSPYMLRALSAFLDWVFTRIYDGMVVDEEGVERVREAARQGSLVFLPSHKSHVDYLVLSFVFYARALMPPLIAAGENLSFFPLGPILRRGGAFFIKRSFAGKKLYSALVDAYIRKLLVEGYPIEFFVEGGRSRTGKLLPPKYGLLSMVVDAAMVLKARRVFFVPISIGYERIVEERSYVHELSGGEKKEENVGGLLRSSTILRSKYGRLYVQFGEIIDFAKLVEDARLEAGVKSDVELSPKDRRAMIQRLAHSVTYQIDRATVVTPAALVASSLLVHRRRGMTHSELRATCEKLLGRLEREGARVAHQIRDENGVLREDTLAEAIALFVDGRLLLEHETGDEAIYKVLEERRLSLEYYKNNLLHFFVPAALIGTALLVDGSATFSKRSMLRARVRELSRTFKYEFMFRTDAEFDVIFDEALGNMIAFGEVEQNAEERLRVAPSADGERVTLYAQMISTYFEAYLLAIRGAGLLLDGPLQKKEWWKRTLALGQRMYLAGEIERRESLSQTKLETALKALKDRELVSIGQGDVLTPGPALTNRTVLKELEALIAPFLKL